MIKGIGACPVPNSDRLSCQPERLVHVVQSDGGEGDIEKVFFQRRHCDVYFEDWIIWCDVYEASSPCFGSICFNKEVERRSIEVAIA